MIGDRRYLEEFKDRSTRYVDGRSDNIKFFN